MAWSTYFTATLWVTCLAILFLAVGFAIPFWLSYLITNAGSEFGLYIGVWYGMACIKGESDSCKSKAIEPEFKDAGLFDDVKIDGTSQENLVELAATIFSYNAYWWAIQIVSTVGFFLCLLAALILICCRCAGIHSRCSFIIATFCMIVGSLLASGIAIMAAVVIGIVFDFVNDFKLTGETFPWSVLVFGIGGLLASLAASMLLIIICKWERYGAYEEDDKESFDDLPMARVNDGYDRTPQDRNPYDYYRKEYNNYDRTRSGYDREPRGYGNSRKYEDFRDPKDDFRETFTRDKFRDSPSRDRGYDRGYGRSMDRNHDRGYDYDRNYSGAQSSEYLYRGYNHHRY